MDEAAMKVITDKLVDPWHRTFARDVVQMYLEHSNKHTFPQAQLGSEDISNTYANPSQNPEIERDIKILETLLKNPPTLD